MAVLTVLETCVIAGRASREWRWQWQQATSIAEESKQGPPNSNGLRGQRLHRCLAYPRVSPPGHQELAETVGGERASPLKTSISGVVAFEVTDFTIV